MGHDKQGLEMTGTGAAIAAYDRAVDSLLRMQPEVVVHSVAALAEDADCVMARVLQAYLGLMSSEAAESRAGAARVAGAVGRTAREQAHLEVVAVWLGGDWHKAARLLDAILAEDPMDSLALSVGHQLDFLLGDAANLKGRPSRALAAWPTGHDHRGFILGMQAFGLGETGDYDRAQAAGHDALAAHGEDVWAIHALAHVHEMRGEPEAGLSLLDGQRANWDANNFLKVHTSWHAAIFALDLGDPDRALEVYDAAVFNAQSRGIAMEMLDGTSLLWRLHLDGVEAGPRWAVLAEAWAGKPTEPWYVFNDLHAIMALIAAGRQAEAEAVLARLEAFAQGPNLPRSNHLAVASAGLAVARGLIAYGRGDFEASVAALAPVRHQLAIFGGSHAQRDVWQRTLLVAAEKAGAKAFAHQLARERLDLRPTSAWARSKLALSR